MSQNKQQERQFNNKMKLILVGAVFVVLVFMQAMGGFSCGTQAAGPIIKPQAIADYIFAHGELPDNFITKDEAKAMGWDESRGKYVSDVAPGKSIGGDHFGNYEGLLPDEDGRTWKEADANYTEGARGLDRIVFSNDGMVFYTSDHYETFIELVSSEE